jgi:hypothetical protein
VKLELWVGIKSREISSRRYRKLIQHKSFFEKKKKTEIGRLYEFENRCLFLIMLDIPFLLICQLQMPPPEPLTHPG